MLRLLEWPGWTRTSLSSSRPKGWADHWTRGVRGAIEALVHACVGTGVDAVQTCWSQWRLAAAAHPDPGRCFPCSWRVCPVPL